MKVCVLNDIDTIYETKMFIEKYLLENNEIESKLTLGDFITEYCDISKCVYVNNGKIMPFKTYEINNERILVVSEESHVKEISSKLEQINYKIEENYMSNTDLITTFMDPSSNPEYFIVNNKFCKI